MAAGQEIIPLGVLTNDAFRAAFVPSGNAASVAILNGASTKSLTYALLSDGLNRNESQETITDERLTLGTTLTRFGSSTEAPELHYLFGDATDVVRTTLAAGTTGFIVCRYAVPNATDWTVGQKVDILAVSLGIQRKDQPTRNGFFAITQSVGITAPTQKDVALTA